jgi:hypothetical protein
VRAKGKAFWEMHGGKSTGPRTVEACAQS